MKTQKELKQEYKLRKSPEGVFQIKNKQTGKVFIGHSQDLSKAANSQFFQLKLGSHRNEALQKDWNIFGPDAFEYSIVEELKAPEDNIYFDMRRALKLLEDVCIQANGNTYNYG